MVPIKLSGLSGNFVAHRSAFSFELLMQTRPSIRACTLGNFLARSISPLPKDWHLCLGQRGPPSPPVGPGARMANGSRWRWGICRVGVRAHSPKRDHKLATHAGNLLLPLAPSRYRFFFTPEGAGGTRLSVRCVRGHSMVKKGDYPETDN